ncbi:MAG: NAD(P)/FAD-dependent oxidoreductase [Acidobacteriota bacterium]
MRTQARAHRYDVAIIGAGAAGIGVAVALGDAGIGNFVVLERHRVGASFALWPAETRFITPSYPTNSIGMLDLNSVVIGTSPAFSLKTEHPTGHAYATYLKAIALHFGLPIREQTNVTRITKEDDEFQIETDDQTVRAKHVIWAAGDFQYPRLNGFAGSEFCQHTAMIGSYDDLEGDDFIVVGGYESGVDAAYYLAQRGKRVRLFDQESPWDSPSSDPSVALSTYSLERMRDERFTQQVKLFPNTQIASVAREGGNYDVVAADGRSFQTAVPPVFAGGFEGSHAFVAPFFEQRDDGFPVLSKHDESTLVPGMFLCGAAVRHDDHIFCFIYKYRQRFAVVAKAIATSMGQPAEALEEYRKWGMYLDDLSCCGEECVC